MCHARMWLPAFRSGLPYCSPILMHRPGSEPATGTLAVQTLSFVPKMNTCAHAAIQTVAGIATGGGESTAPTEEIKDGVLSCRHVIHHDMSWNPSALEQRTGRIDRLGSRAEKVGKEIQVYLPYVEGCQDEKLFRVVMDRERWFGVVMGPSRR